MGFYPPPAKIIPNQEQLGQLERRLQFHPSATTNPKALTRDQIATYNREGYLKGFRIFSADEMVEQRRRFDEVLAAVLAAGGNSYSIISAHIKYGFVYDLLTHPRIVAYVKDILGDEVVGWGAHYFCKLPRDGKIVSWHQDASFWPLTPSKTVTVWLAIDDADQENACMRFVAGSHHLGHLTYRMSEDAEASVLNQTVDNVEQFGTIVYDELKAGEISLHSDLLLHGSLANQSDRRRCGLTLRYCATDVWSDPSYGWNREGVIISGSDPSGHWANPARPSNN
ncbi:MAG: phytanoyl-CoA dioxygenase family protein [Caldilinea sp. CFX5]|nr:phytanoyl-CoA dioxygenase family protein [Caldilinea sp. CFX5]